MSRRLAPLPPMPDLETATADELDAWTAELRAQLQRDLKANQCARPSCQRTRATGYPNCCEGCAFDVGHAPDCVAALD